MRWGHLEPPRSGDAEGAGTSVDTDVLAPTLSTPFAKPYRSGCEFNAFLRKAATSKLDHLTATRTLRRFTDGVTVRQDVVKGTRGGQIGGTRGASESIFQTHSGRDAAPQGKFLFERCRHAPRRDGQELPAAHQKLTTARDGTREVRICVGDVQSRFRVFG